MQPAEAYRRAVVAEQLDGPGVELGQSTFGGVVLGGGGLPVLLALRGLGHRLGVRLHPVAVGLVPGGDALLVPLRAFGDPLAAGGQEQGEPSAGAGDHGQAGADRVDAQRGAGVRLAGPVGLGEQQVQHQPAQGGGEQQADQDQPPGHHA